MIGPVEPCVFRAIERGPRSCYRCGAPLPPRRSRWCSEECSNLYWRNHGWTNARWAALQRSTGFTLEQLEQIGWYAPRFCDDCGEAVEGTPEVNHVEPRNGQGYTPGCWNHQTNLQVLCHACHVAETTRQIRERRGLPDTPGPRPRFPHEAASLELWGAT